MDRFVRVSPATKVSGHPRRATPARHLWRRYHRRQIARELRKRGRVTPWVGFRPPENLWNTVYLDHALDQLRAQGYPVLDADVARLSPYMRKHLNVHGHYTFQLPDLAGGRRPLRDPDTDQDED